MYNFGSPRVGNAPFAQLFDKFVPDGFRVVVDGDIVSSVPYSNAGFKHVFKNNIYIYKYNIFCLIRIYVLDWHGSFNRFCWSWFNNHRFVLYREATKK